MALQQMSLITGYPSLQPQCIKLIHSLAVLSLQKSHFSSASRHLHPLPRPGKLRIRRLQSQLKTQPDHSPTSWPTKVLEEAAQSGQLAISAKVAEAVLDGFLRLSDLSEAGRLCSEHGIQPVDLTKLAKVLNIGPQFTRLSRDLFTAASELKDPSATLLISRTALQHGRPMPRTVLQHLEDMVKEKNHAAMYWQGQLHEAENQDSLALQMYMEAISSAAEGSKGAEAFQIRLGEAWTGVYRMKIERDKEGAHAAIKKAAFEYDEPFAYYFLAKDFTPRTSEEYVTYMQKAAMSGKGKAADALGQHYLEQYQGTQLYSSEKSLNDLIDKLEQEASARKSPSSSTASETPPKAPNKDQAALAMAREWFQLGAEALRIHSSMIYFALILRHQGQADQGLKKLQTFTCRGNMLEVFAFFEKHWNSNSVDLLQIDVEALGSVLRDRSLAKKKSSPTVCKRPG